MNPETAKKLNELLMTYRKNHDYEIGEEIVQILGDTSFWFGANDSAPPPAPKPQPEICFFPSCKYGYQCSRCAQRLPEASPVFCLRGVSSYWCCSCASEEEKAATTTYWRNYHQKTKENHATSQTIT